MNELRHNAYELQQYQSLGLDAKVRMTQQRIKEWYEYWDGEVFVSFSGGKDSTVLLHLVRQMYPDVKAVFSDTGLELPEIRKFAVTTDNVEAIRPNMRFVDVITEYGYPLISKEVAGAIYYARHGSKEKQTALLGKLKGKEGERSQFNKSVWLPIARDLPVRISPYCCNIMKKQPFKHYCKETGLRPFVGMLADESRLRKQAWLKHGCNAYDSKEPSSNPLSFWTEQDVLEYIKANGIEICSVYGEIVPAVSGGLRCSGYSRTGCAFCAFGAHHVYAGPNSFRFAKLQETHPRLWEYCMSGGRWITNPDYDPLMPEYDGEWKNWNPKEIWIPTKRGLGMKKVFDMANAVMNQTVYIYDLK